MNQLKLDIDQVHIKNYPLGTQFAFDLQGGESRFRGTCYDYVGPSGQKWTLSSPANITTGITLDLTQQTTTIKTKNWAQKLFFKFLGFNTK